MIGGYSLNRSYDNFPKGSSAKSIGQVVSYSRRSGDKLTFGLACRSNRPRLCSSQKKNIHSKGYYNVIISRRRCRKQARLTVDRSCALIRADYRPNYRTIIKLGHVVLREVLRFCLHANLNSWDGIYTRILLPMSRRMCT